MTPSDILRAAADRIERYGWTQHESGQDGQRMCVLMALGAACDDAGDRGRNEPSLWRSAKSALERHVRIGSGFVSNWNDAPGRTVDEVLAALRGAAKECE